MTGLAMSAYPVGVGTGVVSGITEIVRYLNSDPIVVQCNLESGRQHTWNAERNSDCVMTELDRTKTDLLCIHFVCARDPTMLLIYGFTCTPRRAEL
jgi:hypothetical protein